MDTMVDVIHFLERFSEMLTMSGLADIVLTLQRVHCCLPQKDGRNLLFRLLASYLL